MADDAPQEVPTTVLTHSTTEKPPEEPPLASVEPPESVKEEEPHLAAVTVIEKEAPLEEPEPEPSSVAEEKVSVTASEKDTTSASAQHESLATVLATPEECEPAPSSQKVQEEAALEPERPKPAGGPISMVSFKEESNVVSDLSASEHRAFEQFKNLVQEALKNQQLSFSPKTAGEVTTEAPDEEVSIWGVPLLKDNRSDVILLKFLRARDFKVKDSFAMLKNTMKWRHEFKVDELVNEEMGDELDKVVFMHGHDKEGHPVCYNVYGEFQNKELYNQTFADEEKRAKFLRWRIQFLEKSIRKLDFSPGGICTIFQVSDLKNSPGPGKRELRIATKQALQLLQDNYPEFVAKQVFINVPWWYLAFYTMISPFLTQRTKSKFVFAGPSKTAETLFKYVTPEQVPIQYGGLSVDFCECNPEFTIDDPATEIIVKPATKQTVEIIVNEKCIIVWELRVVGWEVSYSAEYVPNVEGAYIIIIQKSKKMTPTDEPVVSNSFKISELGKILLTIDNPTSKKKKLLYRFKVKPYSD